jgi:general stress protein 26
MSNTDLYNEEAKEKLKELISDGDVAMMATNLGGKPLSVVPMHTKKIDDDGSIWFLSGNNSDHNRDILQDPTAQLLYNNSGDMNFVSVFGEAQIVSNQDILDDLYDSKDNAWFNGSEDPNLTAIKFTPREAAYWSNDNNKLITFFKLQMAAFTGNDKDIGSSGKMKM